MTLHGQQIIAGERIATSGDSFHGVNPSTGEQLEPSFCEANVKIVDQALERAADAAPVYAALTSAERAVFLDAVGDAIEDLGDILTERAMLETGLPQARLIGERGRAVNQFKMFARVVREGHWVEASIDHAIPDREPLPKPDIRRMRVPIGPVVVFGASNFPIAYSVGGGDTASALAAGNPVIVKAHEAQPGSCELVAEAISRVIREAGLPGGVLSVIQGRSYEIGMALVKHPATRAVGFTGSLRGGRALFDAACARPDPIPVYAEMGSINPVFVLPGALQDRGAEIASVLTDSVTFGIGQFCTSPGVLVALDDPATDQFVEAAKSKFADTNPATMVHAGIRNAFSNGLDALENAPGVSRIATSSTGPDPGKTEGAPTLFLTDSATFRGDETLRRENFGPSSVVVTCTSKEDLLEIARQMDGNLTATIQGNDADFVEYAELIEILKTKVGRILFNGVPTGLEVCPSIQHGGPYPACTLDNATSVGSEAIKRFARPIAFQGAPDSALPPELQESNPLGIRRLVDGTWE